MSGSTVNVPTDGSDNPFSFRMEVLDSSEFS